MKEYRNKRLHISTIDLLFVLVFLGGAVLAAYFSKTYTETKELFNIEKTHVDYTITAPSKDQVSEIQNLGSVDKIIPYLYSAATLSINNETIKSNLFIIENSDDLQYTVFSDSLKIKTASADHINPLYISDDFAEMADVSLGDTVSIPIRNTSVDFCVQGIYKSDHRYVGGTLITILQNDVKNAIVDSDEKDYKYNGAYICSNNLSETDSYLENYIPLGDLKERSDFNSDEQYQIYLQDRENTDYTKSTVYFSTYVKELHNRNDDKMNRELFSMTAAFLTGILISLLWLVIKARKYTKTDVIKDIRNNYSIEQELKMYNRYFNFNLLIYLLAYAGAVMFSTGFFGLRLITLVNIAGLILTVAMVLIAKTVSKNKLKKIFFKKARKA